MGNKVKNSNIINFLASNDAYVSALQMAEEFNVSPKTIYRHVNEINEEFDEEIIKSEKGKGYKIVSSKINPLKQDYSDHFERSPHNRRKNVILKLLFNAPQFFKIDFLYRDNYSSQSTVNSDLSRIKKMLADFGLVLIQKNGSVAVHGEEKSIRETINNFLRYDKDNSQTAPLEGITQIDASFIQSQLDFIQKLSQTEIPYPYNINIYSHIYILIQRVRKQSSRSSDLYNVSIGVAKKEIDQHPDLYRIAEMVIENVGRYVVKPLQNFEVDYLFRYLLSSRLISQGEEAKKKYLYSPLVERCTTDLIEKVSEKLDLNLDQHLLRNHLIRHIGPMINRSKNNIAIENKLLGQIKYEYPDLFDLILKECKKISQKFKIGLISENEVGFITLYFEKSIEMSAKHYHVWIVCASGVGTSELLKMKIQREFKNIIVDRVTSSFDQSLYKSNAFIDLIITTVDLPHKLNVKNVVVSALLNEQDKKKIRDALYE